MNCKPGDLAVFVRSAAGNEGLVVTCLKVADEHELPPQWERQKGPTWIIDRPVKTNIGIVFPLAIDDFLRPIRDNDGTDETLIWAGKPEGVPA